MKNFLVLDLKSGAMDGFYATKALANSMLPFFNERHPNHMWIVVDVVTPLKGMHIPDTTWHCSKLGLGTHGQEK